MGNFDPIVQAGLSDAVSPAIPLVIRYQIAVAVFIEFPVFQAGGQTPLRLRVADPRSECCDTELDPISRTSQFSLAGYGCCVSDAASLKEVSHLPEFGQKRVLAFVLPSSIIFDPCDWAFAIRRGEQELLKCGFAFVQLKS